MIKTEIYAFYLWVMRMAAHGAELLYLSWFRPWFSGQCRFHPTCFPYVKEAFLRFSLGKALFLSIRRLCRCHPWGPMGEDPLPLFPPQKKGPYHGKE